MHTPFEFPIECRFRQNIYEKLTWKEGFLGFDGERCRVVFVAPAVLERWKVDGKSPVLALKDKTTEDIEPVLCADTKKGGSTYEAFDNINLIPSIYELVKKTRSNQNKQAAVKTWIEEHGFLGCNLPPQGVYCGWPRPTWESLTDFWNEAETLADLWDKYKQITQRDLSGMRQWIRFVSREDPVEEIDSRMLFWVGARYNSKERTNDRYSDATLFQIEAKPLLYHQQAGIHYISERIESRLTGLRLFSSDWHITTNLAEDTLKTVPVIKCHSLLQALYLQFFIILSSGATTKKICPNCGMVFEPYRSNQKYCGDTCKHTAKSRRHRQRKRQASKDA